jgi:hypothetical protein
MGFLFKEVLKTQCNPNKCSYMLFSESGREATPATSVAKPLKGRGGCPIGSHNFSFMGNCFFPMNYNTFSLCPHELLIVILAS